MKRRTEETIVDPSKFNYMQAERSENIAEDVVNDVFSEIKKNNEYFTKISSSECVISPKQINFKHIQDDNEDMDPRLKSWNKVLRDRKVLQQRIERRTGKRSEDVLFNRHATIDEQAKHMIIRLLDTAEHNEGVPPSRARGVLKMRHDVKQCREIRELHPTAPKLKDLEFVGLPEITRIEMVGAVPQPSETKWQRSEVLARHLEKHEEKIKNVLCHCPDLDQLQIATQPKNLDEPVVKSQCMGEDLLDKLSSDTPVESTVDTEEAPLPPPDPTLDIVEPVEEWETNNMILINGKPFGFGVSGGALSGDVHLFFQCDPMQRMRKTIVQLENIGSKFIQIRWKMISLFTKELHQRIAYNSEFLFDTHPLVLIPGQKHRIDVMYQPTVVGVKKQRWCMSMQGSPFCGVRRLYVRFHGVCTQPVIYQKRLEFDQHSIVHKRNRQVTERLAKMHAELAPIVDRSTLSCPYRRALDEREMFCLENPGFKCERYADLETLKELYVLVKKPRQPAWDYRLETLRQCIYQHSVEQRESLQNILNEVLASMRCNKNEVFSREQADILRERTRFLYVKGIVGSSIEEWEKIGESLGQQFFKSELQRYKNELEMKGKKLPKDSHEVESVVFKRVLGCKYLKDSLYIQTYTLLCDAAEDIVSTIESTEIL